MHISLGIFVNSLWFTSWSVWKYLESFSSKLIWSQVVGLGFFCFGWGWGGEKGFCTLIIQMVISYSLKQMSHWKQFKYQQNY